MHRKVVLIKWTRPPACSELAEESRKAAQSAEEAGQFKLRLGNLEAEKQACVNDSYGPYSYGPYSYGPYRHGLYSYGPYIS